MCRQNFRWSHGEFWFAGAVYIAAPGDLIYAIIHFETL